MQDNPYSAMINMFRSDAQSRAPNIWYRGTVQSVSPLAVEVCGKPIDKSQLSINAQLIPALTVRDQVILLAEDEGQSFIILCKVVNA